MKKYFVYLSLFILPTLLFFSARALKEAHGAYYLSLNLDPEYVYLLNALNISFLKPTRHVDHPGTTVQTIGALAIRGYHTVKGEKELIVDVLHSPEQYLNNINSILVWINIVLLIISGFLIYRISNKIWIAWFVQLAPFTSIASLSALVDVAPEPFLVSVVLILNIIILKAVIRQDLNEKSDHYALYFALTIALGIATKLTFLPIAVIPLLIINKKSSKLFYLGIMFISLLVMIIPAIFSYSYLFDWIKGLIIHSGEYGSGEPTVINPDLFWSNLGKIAKSEPFFTIIYIISGLALLGFTFIPVLKSQTNKQILEIRVLLGVFITMTLQVIIVAKHYNSRYMIPALMLSVTAFIILIYINVRSDIIRVSSFLRISALLILIVCIGYYQRQHFYNQLFVFKSFRDSNQRIEAYVRTNYTDPVKVFYYSASSPAFAMNFGFGYAPRSDYQKILQILYPSSKFLFYNVYNQTLHDWQGETNFEEVVKSKKIIFQGRGLDTDILQKKYHIILKEKYNEGGEQVFEVIAYE